MLCNCIVSEDTVKHSISCLSSCLASRPELLETHRLGLIAIYKLVKPSNKQERFLNMVEERNDNAKSTCFSCGKSLNSKYNLFLCTEKASIPLCDYGHLKDKTLSDNIEKEYEKIIQEEYDSHLSPNGTLPCCFSTSNGGNCKNTCSGVLKIKPGKERGQVDLKDFPSIIFCSAKCTLSYLKCIGRKGWRDFF